MKDPETDIVTADVRERLRKHLFKELIALPEADWPDDDTDLFGLGLDSIRVIRLLVFIEEEFKVTIPDHAADPRSMATVSALLELIRARRKA